MKCPYQCSEENLYELDALYLNLWLKSWEEPAWWILPPLFSSQVGLINHNMELKSFLSSSLLAAVKSGGGHCCLVLEDFEGCCNKLSVSDWNKSRAGYHWGRPSCNTTEQHESAVYMGSSGSSHFSGALWARIVNTLNWSEREIQVLRERILNSSSCTVFVNLAQAFTKF